MSRVLITGGSGLIGQELRIRLEEKGYEVVLLRRRSKKVPQTKGGIWDVDRGEIDRKALNSSDFIIHLAGANIGAKRWTQKRKKEIRASRIETCHFLFDNLDRQNNKLRAFISASLLPDSFRSRITSSSLLPFIRASVWARKLERSIP